MLISFPTKLVKLYKVWLWPNLICKWKRNGWSNSLRTGPYLDHSTGGGVTIERRSWLTLFCLCLIWVTTIFLSSTRSDWIYLMMGINMDLLQAVSWIILAASTLSSSMMMGFNVWWSTSVIPSRQATNSAPVCYHKWGFANKPWIWWHHLHLGEPYLHRQPRDKRAIGVEFFPASWWVCPTRTLIHLLWHMSYACISG